MMESGAHRDCGDAARRRRGTWKRLLVRESLVRASLIVETHVLGDDASKVVLAEDKEVIEQLSAQCAGQALSEGIHVRRAYRGAHDPHARRREYAGEASTEVRIVVTEEHFGRDIHGGVPGLLRAPLVGRPIRDRGMDDLSAAVEEEEHEDLAETDVVRLDEVACPCDVVAQEGRTHLGHRLEARSVACTAERCASRPCPLPKFDPKTGRRASVVRAMESDVPRCRRCPSLRTMTYSLCWAPCARRSEPEPTSRSRTSRCGSTSPCCAADRSDPNSGASIVSSGCGSLTIGPDGERRSTSFAPRA